MSNITDNDNGSLSEYLLDDGSERPAGLPLQHLVLLRVLGLLLLQLYVQLLLAQALDQLLPSRHQPIRQLVLLPPLQLCLSDLLVHISNRTNYLVELFPIHLQLLLFALLLELEVVNVDCVVLELLVEKVDLLLELVHFVQILVDLGGQVVPRLMEMDDGQIDDGDVLLQFYDVFG